MGTKPPAANRSPRAQRSLPRIRKSFRCSSWGVLESQSVENPQEAGLGVRRVEVGAHRTSPEAAVLGHAISAFDSAGFISAMYRWAVRGDLPRAWSRPFQPRGSSSAPIVLFWPRGHRRGWRMWCGGHGRGSADRASAAGRLRPPVRLSGDAPVEDFGGVLCAVELTLGGHFG